jgi:hypothetical protein
MTTQRAIPFLRASRRTLLAPLALSAVLLLSACAGSTTATAPAATSGSASASTPAAGQKVNANTASVADLQRTFEAAGISNAARWAREVEEYRPYPTDDPTFAKLRQNLAKYNPGPGVVDQIVATLSL